MKRDLGAGAVDEERQVSENSPIEPLLYGSYERALDAKGRFNLPFRFRKKDLGKEEEPPRFMITEDPQGVVSLMTRERYEQSLQGALKQGRGRDQWHFLRWLATHSQEVPLDSQGRVAVPQKYLERIGAGKRLLVLGVGKRMELWEPKRFEAMQTATGSPADEFFEVFYQD
jgi:MraZ protein